MPNAESVRELAGPFVWLFSTGISLTILLLAGALYFWYKSRLRAMLKDGQDIADLAQKKDLLQTEIQRCDEWIKTSHEKLLRLDGERKIQEELRLELANLQKNAAQEQQKVNNSTKELDTIRATVLALSQDKDNLLKEKDYLNKQIESFKAASELNRKAAEDSVFKVRNLREELDMLARKQKTEEERLNALSKTVTELDATRQVFNGGGGNKVRTIN